MLAQNEKLYDQGVTAIVCINDMLAYGVIDSLRERGISVPEDVSVLGFDNLFYSRLTGVSLTTVDQHTEMLARSAVEVLLQKLKMPPGGAGAAGHSAAVQGGVPSSAGGPWDHGSSSCPEPAGVKVTGSGHKICAPGKAGLRGRMPGRAIFVREYSCYSDSVI